MSHTTTHEKERLPADSIFGDLIPEAKAPEKREGFFKRLGLGIARTFLPKSVERQFGIEKEEAPAPEPEQQPFLAPGSIFRDLLPGAPAVAPAPAAPARAPVDFGSLVPEDNRNKFLTATQQPIRLKVMPGIPATFDISESPVPTEDQGFSVAKFIFGTGLSLFKREISERAKVELDPFDLQGKTEKLLSKPKSQQAIRTFVEATSNLPIQSYAVLKSIGQGEFENRHEIYQDLIEKLGDPNAPKIQQFLFQVQNTLPQTAIGVMLTLGATALTRNPVLGYTVGGAYWAALSADEQIRERAAVDSLGNIAIDTVGDLILGRFIGGFLGRPSAVIERTVRQIFTDSGKGFVIEGGTEVAQTLIKLANDFKNADTTAERESIVEAFKDYVLSGDILMEFGVAGVSGGVISGGASLINPNVPPQSLQKPTKPVVTGIDPGGNDYIHVTSQESAETIVNEGFDPSKVTAYDKGLAEGLKTNKVFGDAIYLTKDPTIASDVAINYQNPAKLKAVIDPTAKIVRIDSPEAYNDFIRQVIEKFGDANNTTIPQYVTEVLKADGVEGDVFDGTAIFNTDKVKFSLEGVRETPPPLPPPGIEIFAAPETIISVIPGAQPPVAPPVAPEEAPPPEERPIIPPELEELARVNPVLFRRAQRASNVEEFIESVIKADKTTRESVSVPSLTSFFNRVKGEVITPPTPAPPVQPPREVQEQFRVTITERETELRRQLADQPNAEQELSQIFAELDIAEAGQRLFIRSEVSPDEVTGLPSLFPQFVPDDLRTTKLFTAVLGRFKNIESITFPTNPRATRQRALVNAILEELDSRLGIDTSQIRDDIINSYGKIVQRVTAEEAKEVTRRRADGEERIDRKRRRDALENIFGKEAANDIIGNDVSGFTPKNLGALEKERGIKEVDGIVRRSKIAKELEERLNVPIRRGKFRQRALAIYKHDAKVIRFKRGGLPVIFHEAGHFLHDTTAPFIDLVNQNFRGAKGKILRTTLGVEYANFESKTPKVQRAEAFAEFIRFYYTERDRVRKMAPDFTEKYEAVVEKLPEIRDTMNDAARDYERWLEQPATAKVFSQISFDTKEKRPVTERIRGTYHHLYSSAVDALHPIEEYVKLARGTEGEKIAALDNPYILSRNFKGWVGKATTFLEKGTFGRVFWEIEGNQAKPKFKGKSFKDIVAPIEAAGNLNDLRIFLVSARAIELSKRGIVTGITVKDATTAITTLEKQHPEFVKVAVELDIYQTQLLEYLVENGVLSKKAFVKMKSLNKFYVPFYRVAEELESRGFMGRGFGNVRNRIKKIRGSEREIIDPLESIVKDTYAFIQLAERNSVAVAMARISRANKEVGRLFERVPSDLAPTRVNVEEVIKEAYKQTGSEDLFKVILGQEVTDTFVNLWRPSFFQKGNIITVQLGDKQQHYEVDPDLYRAILALDTEEIATLWRILSIPAKFLRAGATLNPEFQFRNPARDQLTAMVFSRHGYIPVVDLARGLFAYFRRNNAYWLWRMGGGQHATLVSMDRQYLQKSFKEVISGRRSVRFIKRPIEILRTISDIGEQGTRIGEAAKALRRSGADPIEAAFASREVTLDFGRSGSKTKSANMMIAFFNARIQGLDKMIREFKRNPIPTTVRTLIYVTLPSILLYAANREEPEWKEIPQWQKDIFWILIFRKEDGSAVIVRIPKPFELGILFGSVPERILEFIDKGDPAVFDTIKDSLTSGASPGFIPTFLLPILENISNYNFFLDRRIVPEFKEDLPAEAQFTEATSETAKIIAQWIKVSPAKIDNLIRGYFAGLGRYAVDTTDLILEGTGIVNTVEAPTRRFADLPLIRAFVIREPIGGSSQSVTTFYEKAERADGAEKFWKQLVEKGEKEKAAAFLADNPEILVASAYRTIRSQLAELNKVKQKVRQSATLSATRKRTLIDKIDRLITDVAQKALEMTLKVEKK